jgi:ATP-dependent DNA helicase RecQ
MLNTLKKYFGYDSFRPMQEEIISTIIEGKDALVLMPTGGGKSLCYQIPALMMEGTAIVISPLIALMKDQVDALRLNGIKAAYFNSSLSNSEKSGVVNAFQAGELKLLYLSPERLLAEGGYFMNLLKKTKISLFAIDEAHCISQWGHDFRPEYSALGRIKQEFPGKPLIALTATADGRTKEDIIQKLELSKAKKFVSSFNRANIKYTIYPKQDSRKKLLQLLKGFKDESGIIYTLSRKSTERISEYLIEQGYNAKAYHAGLPQNIKSQHQDEFIKDKVDIIVATIAFGMGIDKSNVRFVIHMDLPKNIEGYYQETGRAGRDGLDSEAILFFSRGDVMQLKGFIEIEDNEEQSAVLLQKLDKMVRYCESVVCRRKYLLEYFGESHEGNCGNCDVCLTDYEMIDGTVLGQKALSAVVRLKESFGTGYVIDFLRGSKSAKIKDWHKELPTYGVGSDLSKKEWSHYIQHIVDQAYLKIDTGKFPLLKLTNKSMPLLKGKDSLELIKYKSPLEEEVSYEVISYDQGLFAALRTVRKELAEEYNVAPYLIFSDKTLQELAQYIPLEYNDLGRISGFGAIKLKSYGMPFLECIQAYAIEHGLETKITEKAMPKRKKQSQDTTLKRTDSAKESLDLFKQYKDIAEVGELRNLKLSTIEGHLIAFIETGELSVNDLVETSKKQKIEEAIKAVGPNERLSLIKSKLPEDVSYGEIKAVIASYKRG